jgi:hypothetical protein
VTNAEVAAMSMTGATMVVPMVAVSFFSDGCVHPAVASPAPSDTVRELHDDEYDLDDEQDDDWMGERD